MKIPFSWLPGSWGLRGKTREIARAEYELAGYELESRISAIKHDGDPDALRHSQLEIDLRHGKISQYDYDSGMAVIGKEGTESTLAKLEIDLKHERITNQEYERRRADVTGEPWIAMPKISWDPISPSKTYFELDYNDHFIPYLRQNGYKGSEDECINQWLNDICYSVINEQDQPDPEQIQTIRKIRLPDGKTEHS